MNEFRQKYDLLCNIIGKQPLVKMKVDEETKQLNYKSPALDMLQYNTSKLKDIMSLSDKASVDIVIRNEKLHLDFKALLDQFVIETVQSERFQNEFLNQFNSPITLSSMDDFILIKLRNDHQISLF